MSKSRRPNQATMEEIEEFFDKTKNILGKTGLYYDPITKKFRKAISQDGKKKGSGRSLKLERKFAGYLKKMKDEEQTNILKDASARAIDKGFSALQKERRAFLKEEAKKRDIDVEVNKEQPADEPLQKEAPTKSLRGAKAPKPENVRMEVVEENKEVEEKQKEKIESVVVKEDGNIETLEKASGEVDEAQQTSLRGATPQQEFTAQEGTAEPQAEPQTEPQAEPQEGVKGEVPLTQSVDPTTPQERVVEEIKPAPIPAQASPMVAPSSQRVSMERNRMKYSPEKLRAEIKAFVTIYSDDIKTARFKKLKETKLEGLSLDKLRDLHRDLEEEVIEYYNKQTGLRLGVIIDPAVLGLSVQRLQSVLAPQVAMPTPPIVRDVGSLGTQRDITGGRQITKSADTHYHVGGIAGATNQVMPEGVELQRTSQDEPQATPDRRSEKTRIQIPIKPPRRHLFQPRRRARLPVNLKIKG